MHLLRFLRPGNKQKEQNNHLWQKFKETLHEGNESLYRKLAEEIKDKKLKKQNLEVIVFSSLVRKDYLKIEKIGKKAIKPLVDALAYEELDKEAVRAINRMLKKYGTTILSESLKEIGKTRKDAQRKRAEQLLSSLGDIDDANKVESTKKELLNSIDYYILIPLLKDKFDKAREERSSNSKFSEEYERAGRIRGIIADIFKEIFTMAEQRGDEDVADYICSLFQKELVGLKRQSDDSSKNYEKAETMISLPSIEIKSNTTRQSTPQYEDIKFSVKVKAEIDKLSKSSCYLDSIDNLVKMGNDPKIGTDVKEILLDGYKRAYKIYKWYEPRIKQLCKKYGPLTEKIPLEASKALLEEACKHKDEDIRNLGQKIAEKNYDDSSSILFDFDYGGNVCYGLKKVFEGLGDKELVKRFWKWRKEYLEKEYSYKSSKNENK